MADPFTEFINTELPRRPVTLTLALTGWDADPNDGGAPAVIANAPVGTWFREHTAEKWWRKSESVWEEGGSEPGPGAADKVDKTTGNINMVVDPAGTSPPAGTIVHNQAEYDALGYDLRTVQDVIDILPLGIGHGVVVNLVAGDHLAKADNSGYPGYTVFLQWKPFFNSSNGKMALIPPFFWGPGIFFMGAAQTVLDAAIAGTSTSSWLLSTFTRTAGTWTAHTLKGKFADIVSGSGAGGKYVIRDNTADTLELAGDVYAPGACTINITEPSSKLICSTDGINPDAYGGFSGGFTGVGVWWLDVQLGTVALPWQYHRFLSTANGGLSVYEAYVWSRFVLGAEMDAIGEASCYIGNCDVTGVAAMTSQGAYIWVEGANSEMYMPATYIHGPVGLTLLAAYLGAHLGVQYGSVVEAEAGSATYNSLIRIEGGVRFQTYGSRLIGDGVYSIGVLFPGRYATDSYWYYPSCTISNCAVAVSVVYQTIVIQGGAHFAGSTGNVIGWEVYGSGRVVYMYFSSLTATLGFRIDGQHYAYPVLGEDALNEIVGAFGSSVAMTGG